MRLSGHLAFPQLNAEAVAATLLCIPATTRPYGKRPVILLGAAYPLFDTRRVHLFANLLPTVTLYCVVGFQNSLRTNGSHLLGHINELAIPDVLIATLKHESPYCVGGAAVIFCAFGETPDGGMAILEASGAIPALLRVIETAGPPSDSDKDTGMFQRYVLKHTYVYA
jgi:hypothetical protein